jgi:hypothetical protein
MVSPNIVNREKGSSHPLKPGQFYKGSVEYVDASGQVTVNIRALGSTFGPTLPLGSTTLNKLVKNDVVTCTFTDEFFTDVIVLGSSNIKADVFASKTVVESLVTTITSLQNQIVVLGQRITALENA